MIRPVNNHLLIEPIKHEGFMATQRETYEEIGIVVSCDDALVSEYAFAPAPIKKGDKVYFDAWLAAKYPKEGGNADEFYWLVQWQDVRAIEHTQDALPE